MLSQHIVCCLGLRHCYPWQVKFRKIQLQLAHFSYTLSILYCLRQVAEELFHLSGAFQIEEVAGHLQPFIVIYGSISLNAQQELVSGSVFLVDVMDIAGGHNRDTEFGRQGNKLTVDLLKLRNGMPLDL